MKWKATAMCNDGDTRTKKVFLIFPVRIDDNWVWLERAIAFQEYEGGREPYWRTVRYTQNN